MGLRSTLRLVALATASASISLFARDATVQMQGEQIAGPTCAGLPQWFMRTAARPCTADDTRAWIGDVRHWRMEHRIRVGLDDREYKRQGLLWTQSSFVQPQMMVDDRFFYDPQARRYTVDRYLEEVNARYGGIDSVLVWPTYPNIGIDDRNQTSFMIYREAQKV